MACSPPKKDFENVLLAQSGTWRRGDVSKPASIPELVSRLGVEDAAEATYSGAGKVTVHVFRMRAETSAFELMQKWRQQDGVATYKGAYFFVARAEGADAVAVSGLLRDLAAAA
jgi:hypothetical protein